MPDPSASDALAEAYASAPADEVVIPTFELRHPSFVDEDGLPDSLWLTPNDSDVDAVVEASAPLRGGETVTYRSFPFRFALAPIENSASQELQLAIDGVDRRIVENLDLAMASAVKIQLGYRPYLASDLSGPQIEVALVFTLTKVKVDGLTVTGSARIDIDLNGAFPRRVYTAAEFAALIGQ